MGEVLHECWGSGCFTSHTVVSEPDVRRGDPRERDLGSASFYQIGAVR